VSPVPSNRNESKSRTCFAVLTSVASNTIADSVVAVTVHGALVRAGTSSASEADFDSKVTALGRASVAMNTSIPESSGSITDFNKTVRINSGIDIITAAKDIRLVRMEEMGPFSVLRREGGSALVLDVNVCVELRSSADLVQFEGQFSGGLVEADMEIRPLAVLNTALAPESNLETSIL